MSIDSRDWYVDKLRKANAYVEKAAFRISIGEARRKRERRQGWGQLLGAFALVLGVAFVALILLKLMLSR